MQALRGHFLDEGNVTRRIAEAEHICNTLQCKNERNLTFETYLTKCAKIYSIFKLHGKNVVRRKSQVPTQENSTFWHGC